MFETCVQRHVHAWPVSPVPASALAGAGQKNGSAANLNIDCGVAL
ncbi:hypothetical protein [Mycobacterium palustre]|nr:hypothetical protein [Mycobacterium palustre]